MNEFDKLQSMLEDMNRRRDALHGEMLQLKSLNGEIRKLGSQAHHDPVVKKRLNHVNHIMAEANGKHLISRLTTTIDQFDTVYGALEKQRQKNSTASSLREPSKDDIHRKAKKKFSRAFA